MKANLLNKAIPVIVFVVAAVIGLATSYFAFRNATDAEEVRFGTVADDVVEALNLRLSQHESLLRATSAYFDVNQTLPAREEFATFIEQLNIATTYDGIQGIGYAAFVPTGQEFRVESWIEENYQPSAAVFPTETDQNLRTPIVLLEPQDEKNRRALAYDMFSEPERREGMLRALISGEPRLTAPVELVQENEAVKQIGFLLYVPYTAPWGTSEFSQELFALLDSIGVPRAHGFVYAPFRTGDLVDAALANMARIQVLVEISDVSEDGEQLLYRSAEFEELYKPGALAAHRDLMTGGREWKITVYSAPDYEQSMEKTLALIMGAISLLLATALGVSARAQLAAAESARALQLQSENNLAQKDLMLQEMKHRIKNSIARIMAIARQSARQTDDKAEFESSLMSRLQAMSRAQEMLTRSNWQRAELKMLIHAELEQILEAEDVSLDVDGPQVELDERAAQAMSLTIHELATNAMKYGVAAAQQFSISVQWKIVGEAADDWMLEILWQEQGVPAEKPEKTGFGTKLIDANIRGELNGAVERTYGEDGFSILIKIPASRITVVDAAHQPKPKRRVRKRKPKKATPRSKSQ